MTTNTNTNTTPTPNPTPPTTTPPNRLYGTPNTEHLHDTLAAAWEHHLDERHEPPETGEHIEFHEWTVANPRNHLPDDWRILEEISEWAADNGMLDEYVTAATQSDLSKLAANELLDTIAAQITYRMADRHIDTHWITLDNEDRPVTWTNEQSRDQATPLYRPERHAAAYDVDRCYVRWTITYHDTPVKDARHFESGGGAIVYHYRIDIVHGDRELHIYPCHCPETDR